MSEEAKKVIGVRRLPIFPLPLVLMPHELLPLHLFEPRYRTMLEDVQDKNNLFGVSFFEPQDSFLEKPPIDSIGCVAEVKESQILEDGRSNILTNGIIRYSANDYIDADKPYLVAEVDFFEDDDEEDAASEPLAGEVLALFKRAATAAQKISGQPAHLPDIPKTEPEQMSFMISAAFNLNNELKYKLLEMRSTSERLAKLKEFLTETAREAEETSRIGEISRTNGHAKTDIDFE